MPAAKQGDRRVLWRATVWTDRGMKIGLCRAERERVECTGNQGGGVVPVASGFGLTGSSSRREDHNHLEGYII